MIEINLLPIKAKKKSELARQFVSLYFLSVLLAMSVIGYLWHSNGERIDSGRKRLARVQQEVSNYSKYEDILKELTAKKEIVDKKRTIIEDLQKDRDSIVRILALLAVQVPPDKMWFEKFVQTSNVIVVDGVALSNEAIVEFMRNLESSPYIEKGSVNLVHSRRTVVSSMKLREFQVSYRFHPYSDVKKKAKTQPS